MNTIHKETLQFLNQLRKNNNRAWFNERKVHFKSLEKEVKSFYDEVATLLSQHDRIQYVKPYRIYRDIRFSKDKTPYKRYLSAHFARQKPQLRGGYYLHLEPNDGSFVQAGFWRPNKNDLKRVREEWLSDTAELKQILNQKTFQEHWGEMKGEQLKTAPRGFDKHHPDIGFINHKQWIFHHSFTDAAVLSADFAKKIDQHYQAIRPFFDYMSEVLTTNLNGELII